MLRPEPAQRREVAFDHSSRGHGATLRPLLQILSALLCLSTAAACGSDDSDDDTAGASTDANGSAAVGGRSGGATGATTPPPPAPVACGATTCNPPANPLSGILSMFGGAFGGALPSPQACCLDESAGTCGVSPGAGNTTCAALAVVDTRCPKANLGMLGSFVNIQPCCVDDQCGQDGKLFGQGCVQNSEVMSMLGALAGGMFQLPPSVACDAALTPPTTTPDAEDAGVPGDTDAGI